MTIVTPASGGRTVSVWRDGQFLVVSPGDEAVLQRVLRTRPWSCRASEDGTLRSGRRREPLYELVPFAREQVLKCWAGLTPAVTGTLRLCGYRPAIVGGLFHGRLPLPADKNLLDSLADRVLIEYVARHDRGLVRYDAHQVEPAKLVAQVARAWPDLNLTAAVSRRDEAIRLAYQLRAANVDAFAFTARNQPWVEKRVAVATYAGLAYNPVHPARQDVVLALDAAEATGLHPRWCLRHLERARLYGLQPANRPLSPYEEDLVRALFGFQELLVPRHGHVGRPVEVLWTEGQGRRLGAEPANDLDLKRHAVWRQDARNRQVARVARALAGGDPEQLKALLPSLPGARRTAGPSRVLVLVEGVEHALALMTKLPGWPVVTSGLADLDGLQPDQRADLEARRPTWAADPISRGIVTDTGLQSVNIHWSGVDVLVRADGGTGSLSLPAAALTVPAVDPRARTPLLVVDLADRHHPDLRQRAVRRRRAYVGSGWARPGLDPAVFRTIQFVKRRLKGGQP
jgi:hypothetical protein